MANTDIDKNMLCLTAVQLFILFIPPLNPNTPHSQHRQKEATNSAI